MSRKAALTADCADVTKAVTWKGVHVGCCLGHSPARWGFLVSAFAREHMEVWDDLFLSYKVTKLAAGALSP